MANNNINFSTIRGDDDVFALLNEMTHAAAGSSSRGHKAAPKSNGNDVMSSSSLSSATCTSSSLFPTMAMEDKDHCCAGNDTIVTQQQGGMMTARQFQLGLCNPHVEIIRHRQHEKFKASFYDLFRAQCSSTYNNNHKSNINSMSEKIGCGNGQQQQQQQIHIIRSTISTIWKSIPPHTIWERFQFSLKTLEAECVRELITASEDSSSNEITNRSTITTLTTTPMQQMQQRRLQHLAFPTVHQLYSHMVHSRSRGTYWEPLLPVPSVMNCTAGEYYDDDDADANNQQRGRKMNERYRNETLQLLRGEIEFQFRRVFKKVVGNQKGGSVATLFLQLGGGGGGGGGDDGKKKKTSKKRHPSKKFKDDKDGENCDDDTKNASHDNEVHHDDDGEEKEDYILQTIFTSQPFQKLTLKLHKKFFHLAEDTYCAFLAEIQKCSNRLLEEERKQASSCVHGRKKKKQKQKDYHGMPKIVKVEYDNVDDGDNKKNDDDDPSDGERNQQVKVTFMGISLRVNDWHREKLMSLYKRSLSNLLHLKREVDIHEDENANAMQIQHQYNHLQEQFPKLLFSLLLRYDALEGAGLQSAIPPTVFRYLHRRFGCEFECFASPFNCSWLEKDSGRGGGVGGRYGSAYGDTDAMFGSFGSFFDLDFLNLSHGSGSRGGCYQANPPFASEFIEKMYHRMHKFLTLSDQATEDNDPASKKVVDGGNEMDKIPLMFVVFVPSWSKCSGWRMLSSSPYLTKHILLNQKEDVHYYAEGTQHRRKRHNSSHKEGHRIASFDTSVFFLQNSGAKAKWPIIGEDEKLLKDAFAMIPTKKYDVDERKTLEKIVARGRNSKQSTTTTLDVTNILDDKSTSSSRKISTEASSSAKKNRSAKRKKSVVLDKAASKLKGGDAGAAKTISKKKRLMAGGQDELRILASMGILDGDGTK